MVCALTLMTHQPKIAMTIDIAGRKLFQTMLRIRSKLHGAPRMVVVSGKIVQT